METSSLSGTKRGWGSGWSETCVGEWDRHWQIWCAVNEGKWKPCLDWQWKCKTCCRYSRRISEDVAICSWFIFYWPSFRGCWFSDHFVNNVHFAATKDSLSRHFNKVWGSGKSDYSNWCCYRAAKGVCLCRVHAKRGCRTCSFSWWHLLYVTYSQGCEETLPIKNPLLVWHGPTLPGVLPLLLDGFHGHLWAMWHSWFSSYLILKMFSQISFCKYLSLILIFK